MRVPKRLLVVMLCAGVTAIGSAQDAVKVDGDYYTVISENDQVRILKIHYGAHEKSVMHSHPDTVVVFLTDAKVQFSAPDGKKLENDFKAGQAQFAPAMVHLPENVGDQPMDGILIELKGKSGKAAKSAKKK